MVCRVRMSSRSSAKSGPHVRRSGREAITDAWLCHPAAVTSSSTIWSERAKRVTPIKVEAGAAPARAKRPARSG